MALATADIVTEVRALVRVAEGQTATFERFVYMALDDILRQVWGTPAGRYLFKDFLTIASGAYEFTWNPSTKGDVMGVPIGLSFVSGGIHYHPEWMAWKEFQENKLYEIQVLNTTGRPLFWTVERTDTSYAPNPDVTFKIQVFPKADANYAGFIYLKWQPFEGDERGLKLDLMDHLLVIGGAYYASRVYRTDLASLWRTRFSTALREFSIAVSEHTGLRAMGAGHQRRMPRTHKGPWIPDWIS